MIVHVFARPSDPLVRSALGFPQRLDIFSACSFVSSDTFSPELPAPSLIRDLSHPPMFSPLKTAIFVFFLLLEGSHTNFWSRYIDLRLLNGFWSTLFISSPPFVYRFSQPALLFQLVLVILVPPHLLFGCFLGCIGSKSGYFFLVLPLGESFLLVGFSFS